MCPTATAVKPGQKEAPQGARHPTLMCICWVSESSTLGSCRVRNRRCCAGVGGKTTSRKQWRMTDTLSQQYRVHSSMACRYAPPRQPLAPQRTPVAGWTFFSATTTAHFCSSRSAFPPGTAARACAHHPVLLPAAAAPQANCQRRASQPGGQRDNGGGEAAAKGRLLFVVRTEPCRCLLPTAYRYLRRSWRMVVFARIYCLPLEFF